MKTLTNLEFKRDGQKNNAIVSRETLGQSKQITALQEENGVFKYETQDGVKEISGGGVEIENITLSLTKNIKTLIELDRVQAGIPDNVDFWGYDMWTYNGHTYFSFRKTQKELINGVFVDKVWKGDSNIIQNLNGRDIFNCNGTIYHFSDSYSAELQGDTWVKKKWYDDNGNSIQTFSGKTFQYKNEMYMSYRMWNSTEFTNYKLVNGVWKKFVWNGQVIDKNKEWNQNRNFWNTKNHLYYTYNTEGALYKTLELQGDTWVEKKWEQYEAKVPSVRTFEINGERYFQGGGDKNTLHYNVDTEQFEVEVFMDRYITYDGRNVFQDYAGRIYITHPYADFTEFYQLLTDELWQPIDLKPYTVKQTITFTKPIKDNSVVTLLNSVKNRDFGLAINDNITTTNAEILAITKPNRSVDISIGIEKGKVIQ